MRINFHSATFRALLFNWPVRSDSRRRVIARSDRSEERSFSVLLYFYTPPKPLISKLFNHDISPSLSLSRDSRALRCRRRRRRRRLLFFSFPRCPSNPPLTDTNTTTSRKISRDVLRVHVDSRRAVSSVAQSCRTYFSTPRKSHPPIGRHPTSGINFSHSLFLSFSLSLLRTLLYSDPSFSLTLFLTLRTHPNSLTVTLTSLSVFSFSISFFLSAPESARLLSSLCLSYLFELR